MRAGAGGRADQARVELNGNPVLRKKSMMQYYRPELCHILCHICGTCGTHIKYATLCGTCSLLLTPCSLLLTPCSLLLAPYSLLLTPYSLLLTPALIPLL